MDIDTSCSKYNSIIVSLKRHLALTTTSSVMLCHSFSYPSSSLTFSSSKMDYSTLIDLPSLLSIVLKIENQIYQVHVSSSGVETIENGDNARQ